MKPVPPTAGIAVPDFVEVAARAHPARLAIEFGAERWTFADLQRAVSSVAGHLRPILDRVPDGRLGILSSNRPGVVFAAHAAARLGLSYVPLNWRLSGVELAWQVQAAGITVLIVEDRHRELAVRAMAGLPVTLVAMAEIERAPLVGHDVAPAPAIALDREAAVLFTSGTSGRPKGARLTYGNLWFSAAASALTLGQRADDRWLAVLSLFHIGGLSIIYRGVIGATPVSLLDRFDPLMALDEVARGATLVSLVPTMLRRMIDQGAPGFWPKSLRAVLLGGGPTPLGLVGESLDRGIPIAPTYGLTESASQATTLLPDAVKDHQGSSGLPLPVTRIRIVEDGRPLALGVTGDIELQGPTIFRGYLDETEVGFCNPNPWFATRDVGYLDDRGFLYVVDRRQDLIVSGGENVYPAEIERVLLEHPQVADAGVIGLVDDEWGMRPVAAVVWRGDCCAAVETLKTHCGTRLARFKMPDQYRFVSELPRSASGKLLRRQLKALFEQSG